MAQPVATPTTTTSGGCGGGGGGGSTSSSSGMICGDMVSFRETLRDTFREHVLMGGNNGTLGLPNGTNDSTLQIHVPSSGKSCCGIYLTQAVSIRWFIILIAFFGVCCSVAGTILGALKASVGEHLTISLLMIGNLFNSVLLLFLTQFQGHTHFKRRM